MSANDALVLPADVLLVPFAELPAGLRERTSGTSDDYLLTRPGARTPSRIVDADAAALLSEFRAPRTIVEAVIRYSQAHRVDPEATLDAAFPLLERLMSSGTLLRAEEAQAILAPSLVPGDHVAGYSIVRCVQSLEDTELYQSRSAEQRTIALKLLRSGSPQHLHYMFEREAAILRHLDSGVSPRFLEAGMWNARPFLAMEWRSGVPVTAAADELRQLGAPDARHKLLRLCVAVLDAYAHLHNNQVIHGDVHPHNVLVAADGSISIVDYGLARIVATTKLPEPPRGGVGFFLEPEYARAYGDRRPPAATMVGEQYSLAALLYQLLTGTAYLPFSLQTDELLRQIVEDPPLSFAEQGCSAWPEVEAILAVALHKDPACRFASVTEFAHRLREVDTAATVKVVATAGAVLAPSMEQALLDDVLRRLEPDEKFFATLGEAPTCSVSHGAAGIAYTFYRIATLRQDACLLSLADIWITRALIRSRDPDAFYNAALDMTPSTIGSASPYHTASGVHAVQAFISHALGDFVVQQWATNSFVATSKAPSDQLDLTTGRSGTLVAASALLDRMHDHLLIESAALRALGDETLQSIWSRLQGDDALQESTAVPYLGMAHGWAGVLYAALRWCQATRSPVPAPVRVRLDQLAALAEPAGRGVRWSCTLAGSSRLDVHQAMPGWCHGSAGYVHLWTLAAEIFGDAAYLDLAVQAAWNTWETADSTANLCCGAAGRAYALINIYKHTQDPHWLARARQLARRAAEHIRTSTLPGDRMRSDSLYKGELGVALLVAELGHPTAACMPFFESEGWTPAQVQESNGELPFVFSSTT